MKKASQKGADELRSEYKRSDFGKLVRGKYAARLAAETNVVPQGGPHIGIGEKRSVPIGVGGGEIGATRSMGATIMRRDGIIPPMIGADTRRTLAF